MLETIVLEDYISPLILVACLVIGFLIKNCGNNSKVNQYIPLIVAVCGVIFNVWFTGVFDLMTLVVGAVSGLASSGAHDMVINLVKLTRFNTVEKEAEVNEAEAIENEEDDRK